MKFSTILLFGAVAGGRMSISARNRVGSLHFLSLMVVFDAVRLKLVLSVI